MPRSDSTDRRSMGSFSDPDHSDWVTQRLSHVIIDLRGTRQALNL